MKKLAAIILLILLPAAYCGISYDSANNIIRVTGTNGGVPWTPEDIYQTCISNGWGVCYKYLESSDSQVRPVYVFTAGIRIGDGVTYTEFSAKECVIIVDPNFVTFPNSVVYFGENDSGVGVKGVILIAKKESTISVPSGDPADWYCVYFRGAAYIYGSKLVCEYSGYWPGGCVAFATHDDTTPQIVVDSVFVAGNGIRFQSGNLTLIRVKMEHLGSRGDFVEFASAPAYLEDITVQYFNYYVSFYRPTGDIVVYGLHSYGCPNAISLPDRANQRQVIVDMEPFYDPTRLEALRGWNMENATVEYKFTLNIKILDEEGNPVSDAFVQIYDSKGNLVYNGTVSGSITLTPISYKAVVRSSQDTTADFSKQFGSWWWNVWKYTPFTVKVFKYGYKPFVTTIDLKRKTDLLVILENDPIISELGIDETTARSLPISCSRSATGIYHCTISTSNTLFTETQPFDLRYLYAWTRAQYNETLFDIIDSPAAGIWVLRGVKLVLDPYVVWKEEDIALKYILDVSWTTSIDGTSAIYISNDAKIIWGRLDSTNPIRTSHGVTIFVEPDDPSATGEYERINFVEAAPAGEFDFYGSKAVLLPVPKDITFAYGGAQYVYLSTITGFRSSARDALQGKYYEVSFTNTYTTFENPSIEVEDISASGVRYGIVLSGGWVGEIRGFKVDPTDAGFYLEGFFGEVNITNFETTNMNRYWTGDPTQNTGVIRILYNLTVKVVDKDNNPIPGATVIITDALNNTVFDGVTGTDGTVSLTVTSYEIRGIGSTGTNADNLINYNPFTITVSKEGFVTMSLKTNITKETLFVFPLINKSEVVLYDLVIDAPDKVASGSAFTARIIITNKGTAGGETRLTINVTGVAGEYSNTQQFYLDANETKVVKVTLFVPKGKEGSIFITARALPIGANGVEAYAEKKISVYAPMRVPTILPVIVGISAVIFVVRRKI